MSAAIILCSTSRLARSLRMAHDRRQHGLGKTQWQPLPAMPLAQWLDAVIGDALLRGDIIAGDAPALIPGTQQERILWERAIDAVLGDTQARALFDLAGLAAAAMEANHLLQAWRIALPVGELAEEAQQFLRWRAAFRKACAQTGWLEPARYLDWQIAQLAAGAAQLPPAVAVAGFDRLSPQEAHLLEVLAERGVTVEVRNSGTDRPADGVQVKLADQEAECRAAIAWAQQQVRENPQVRIAIVAPDLGAVRSRLAALLDDALHPAALMPASAEMPRSYDFSLGVPLTAQPVVATALGLLGVFAGPRRVEQETLGMLLLCPGWSADGREADGRAQLEAAMRTDLPAVLSLDRLARYSRRMSDRGLAVTQLADHLESVLQLLGRQPQRQLPSAWASGFRSLLAAAGWPGERGLSSHEYQARQAFHEALDALSQLDVLLGGIDMPEALRRCSQICAEQVFQPRSEGDPAITVMGMLEAVAEPMDALWVMGMNDHLWPPPARPNPLLPAAAQRAARSPNADAGVQAEFARLIHARLLRSAPYVVFSHALADGDRMLRPSPLLEDLPLLERVPLLSTLAETLAMASSDALESVTDRFAPAVAPGEHVSGGASLLRAQAVCPAWAYYQYRLGACHLDTPLDGLDAAGRGSLLHAALERFWRGRGLAALSAMEDAALTIAVREAVEQALAAFDAERDEPLPAGFAAIEAERLQRVLRSWLAFEKTREIPFEVRDCEREVRLSIAGIDVRLVLDRIDTLEDGRLVIIDYKTGAAQDCRNWAQMRISEPQLPIYASLALAGEQVVAVAYARVRPDDARFVGIAADDGVLPGVPGLAQSKARKDFPEERFPGWEALLSHWKVSVEAIAREVRAGEAAVRFSGEGDLAYCEVRPLLRLPERKLLYERASMRPF